MTEDCEDGKEISVPVAAENAGERLDAFLAAQCADLSRSRLKALILEGQVDVDGMVCIDPSRKVKGESIVTVLVPPAEEAEPVAEDIPLDILYEDAELIVLCKPAGMVVHPAPGHARGTLVNALLHHCGDSLSGIGGVRRPGIVHRLDRDTSGLMIVAKTDRAHQVLSAQLADRSLERRYRALVWGVPTHRKGTVDQPVGRHPAHRQRMAVNRRSGRAAVTHYETIETYGQAAALLECRLETGRTHQIRVHMESIRHWLAGDPVYGIQPTALAALLKKAGYGTGPASFILGFPRQALHAWRLSFLHPVSGEVMAFERTDPEDMTSLINCFKTI